MYFYDTCSLLNELQGAFNEHFLISTITLQELEEIKTSAHKDEDVKFRARRLVHLLAENEDKYTLLPFTKDLEEEGEDSFLDLTTNDAKIILTAYNYALTHDDGVVFYTQDLCCYHLAKLLNCECFMAKYQTEEDSSDYEGFKEVIFNDEELSDFYSNLKTWNEIELYVNEYLLIKNEQGQTIDKYRKTENGFEKVTYPTLDSNMFGRIKAKDDYQQLVMDSFTHNQITMIRGAAGTGKSYLSFAFLFEMLEKRQIDKIIVFCNTVATSGSAKLGFYPGTRDEKLLDSQIGNLFSSKIGDKIMVENLIAEGKLVLLPMSDIRGYDTTGANAGVYIPEAQNMDIELMRLALQRIGEDSICILDGDSNAQVDLPLYAGRNNGMRRVSEIFRGSPFYGEVTLKTIHRSKIAELAQKL